MDQTQYATETYIDMHLANELADILRTRVKFIFSGAISMGSNEYFNNVQDNLEYIKARMHTRTVDHYQIKELS